MGKIEFAEELISFERYMISFPFQSQVYLTFHQRLPSSCSIYLPNNSLFLPPSPPPPIDYPHLPSLQETSHPLPANSIMFRISTPLPPNSRQSSLVTDCSETKPQANAMVPNQSTLGSRPDPKRLIHYRKTPLSRQHRGSRSGICIVK